MLDVLLFLDGGNLNVKALQLVCESCSVTDITLDISLGELTQSQGTTTIVCGERRIASRKERYKRSSSRL
jgi:hypothetical protein